MKNITFIIKTFERFYCIKRLIRSILKKYPNAKILIADDSKVSCKDYFFKTDIYKNVEVFELPSDCGLSYGRNFLVDKVKTDYFVLLDDDFVFDGKTDIEAALKILKEKNLDILGGFIRNYKVVKNIISYVKCKLYSVIRRETPANYIGSLSLDKVNQVLNVNCVRDQFPDYSDTDLVMNFFIAKTESIRLKNRWDDELKLGEHTAFFFNAKINGLKVGFSNCFSVQHKPVRLKSYLKYRDRNYVKLFMKKHGIKKIIANYDDGEVKITDSDNLD